jgi:hypothetical protein
MHDCSTGDSAYVHGSQGSMERVATSRGATQTLPVSKAGFKSAISLIGRIACVSEI